MELRNFFYKFNNIAFWVVIFFFTLIIGFVECKGTGVISASGGGGSDSICTDCASNYTDEELKWALIVLCTILTIFLLILCCQCSSRIVNECERQKRLSNNKNDSYFSNNLNRHLHLCEHSLYGSTKPYISTNHKINNLNCSLSQLNGGKNFDSNLAKRCSVAAIVCAAAITSPEKKKNSSQILDIDHHQHYHEHQNINSSRVDQKFNNLYLNLKNQNENNLSKKSLRRSATLAECNWPIDDIKLEIEPNLHKQKLTKSLKNCTTPSSTSDIKKISQNSSSISKLNFSTLATVIAAQNEFNKLKKYARASTIQSFKSLPPPPYLRNPQTTEYI